MREGVTTASGEPRLDIVLETAHDAFVSMGEDGRIAGWNPAAERLFGWSKAEALGRPLRELIIPERYRAQHERGLRRFLETGEGPVLNKRIELEALRRDGEELPVELTISALRLRGRWTFNAFLRDVSDRYRAAEAESRLASIVRASADAIYSRTADGTVTSWNPAAEKLFGYRAGEIVGGTMDPLVPAGRAGEADELLERVLSGNAVAGYETQRLRKDGALVDVSITMSPIYDEPGAVREVSIIARDISIRKRSERALERANEELRRLSDLKSELVAVTSHELRAPLTSIRGFLTTLRARWEQISERDKLTFLDIVDEQTRRLKRLADAVLELSRLEAGAQKPEPEAVDIAALVRATLEEHDFGEVELVAEGGCVAQADRDDLRRILINYLENARRYGADPLIVKVRPAGEHVEVRVCDHGDGVAPDFVQDLFDRFTRDTRAGEHVGATGLGLAIVKRLAEANGGDAWYEPNQPRGSAFCVRLPSALPQA